LAGKKRCDYSSGQPRCRHSERNLGVAMLKLAGKLLHRTTKVL
jgi:hypothetical protein